MSLTLPSEAERSVIQRIADEAPSLSAAQREKLRALFTGGAVPASPQKPRPVPKQKITLSEDELVTIVANAVEEALEEVMPDLERLERQRQANREKSRRWREQERLAAAASRTPEQEQAAQDRDRLLASRMSRRSDR